MTQPCITAWRIAVVGAGAVGGWVGGQLARAGFDVVLVDAWPEHVAVLKAHGIGLASGSDTCQVPIRALHVGEAQSLHARPVDVAFLCVKLYDTQWAAALIAPYLAPEGFVVTLQNGLIEDRVAAIVGWERTVGCIGGGLYLRMDGPGRIRRTRQPAAGAGHVFQAGEVHGRATPRVQGVARLLQNVDGTEVTSNLWGARWSKLVANCMTSALSGASGLPLDRLFIDPLGRRVMTRLAAEAAATGMAHGFCIENIFGLGPAIWVAAAQGDAGASAQADAAFQTRLAAIGAGTYPGIAQDLAKGRRTEIDFMNGYVAAQAASGGVGAPTHAKLAAMVKDIEKGLYEPGAQTLDTLLREPS